MICFFFLRLELAFAIIIKIIVMECTLGYLYYTNIVLLTSLFDNSGYFADSNYSVLTDYDL